MTFEEFETLIEESLNGLPKQFKDILIKNEISLIPRQKAPKPLSETHKGSIVFGVFIGVPFGHFVNVQTEPTRIELYKESFEAFYKDPEEIKQKIRSTVVHEIAHYFGFKEQEIRKLGY
jgi:predicted Zn-dependent protease with MMP-like domain